MLPPAHRLRRSADFSAVVRGGRRAGRRHLVVHLLTPAPSGAAGETPAGRDGGTTTDERLRATAPALVGFVVSKAVGGSVVRNRVERRLRHLVREQLDRLPEGSRAVVRANPPAAAAGSAELRRDLTSALDRLGARP